MTAAPKKVIPSVDYTSRDYDSLRTELIYRVKDRTDNKWLGNDPADFGLALIESFAYMGDLINYYIDRIANESYILTATQRQSLLNLASMYGYYPKGYVGASCSATFTSEYGYRGAIGGSILDTKKAYLIVPNDQPFTTGDVVRISGRAEDAYNGTFTLLDNSSLPSGIIGAGGTSTNVIVYQPSANITNYTVTTVSSGVYNITFTYAFSYPKSFVAGQSVIVSGVGMSSSGTGTVNGTFTVANATSTTFTTTNITATVPTKTFLSTGIAEFSNIAISSTAAGYVYETGHTVLPAGTQFSTDVTYGDTVEQVVFSTANTVSIPYQGNVSVDIKQGQNITALTDNAYDPMITGDISGEYLGSSTGLVNQYFALSEPKVDSDTVAVYVQSGNRYVLWKKVDNLNDWNGTSTVYTLSTNDEGISFIVFGDNISGAVPPQDSKIKAQYFAGVGEFGNISANTLDYYYFPNVSSIDQATIRSSISFTHTAATGGADPETDDSIRVNAPKALRALNRAVTLQDYADVALTVTGVGKATAVASTWSSINLYVAPTVSGSVTAPVITQTTLDTVTSAVNAKSQIGTTVQVYAPSYSDIKVFISLSYVPDYVAEQVKKSVIATLLDVFSYSTSSFGQIITPSDVEFVCRNVPGVDIAKVTALYRNGGSGLNTLIAKENELFNFTENNITVAVANSAATLTAVTTSLGSPTAVANSLGYTLTVASGSTAITVTPTVSSGATVSVADKQVLSGTASSGIGLTSGTTKRIWIIVTAENNQITNNYYIDVTTP
jgi:hypothetical protein